jgi:hypothetical protein
MWLPSASTYLWTVWDLKHGIRPESDYTDHDGAPQF